MKKTFVREIKRINLDMAYLALGGDPEKKKHIDRDKLVSVLQDEFALTIDVQVQFYLTPAFNKGNRFEWLK